MPGAKSLKHFAGRYRRQREPAPPTPFQLLYREEKAAAAARHTSETQQSEDALAKARALMGELNPSARNKKPSPETASP